MPHFSTRASLFCFFLSKCRFVTAVQTFPARAFGLPTATPTARNRGSAASAGLATLGDCAGGLFRGDVGAISGGLFGCAGFAFGHGVVCVMWWRFFLRILMWLIAVAVALSRSARNLAAMAICSSTILNSPRIGHGFRAVCLRSVITQTPSRLFSRPARVFSRSRSSASPSLGTIGIYRSVRGMRSPWRTLTASGPSRTKCIGSSYPCSLVLLGFVIADENLRLPPCVRASQVNHAAKYRRPVIRPQSLP